MNDISKENKVSFKDKVAIVASIVAVAISLFTFSRDYLFAQHVLRASVVRVDEVYKVSAPPASIADSRWRNAKYKKQIGLAISAWL